MPRRTPIIIGSILAALILAGAATYFRPFLRTQVAPGESEEIIGGKLDGSKLALGDHTLTYTAKTQSGAERSSDVPFTIAAQEESSPTPPISSGGPSTGSGGGGGDGGGGGGDEIPKPVRRIFEAEAGRKSGGTIYSKVERDQNRTVFRFADSRAKLSFPLTNVIRGTYALNCTIKNDLPPVIMRFSLGRTTKEISITKGDGKYSSYIVFPSLVNPNGNVTIQFMNDLWNPARGQNRDGVVDRCELKPKTAARPTTTPKAVGGPSTRSAGWNVLPNLNTTIKRILGKRFVNPTIWACYASRLTANPKLATTIQTQAKLEQAMTAARSKNPPCP